MKSQVFKLTDLTNNEVSNFKSRRQAFTYCVQKGWCENSGHGIKQKMELDKLVSQKKIELIEEFVDQSSWVIITEDVKKIIKQQIAAAIKTIPPKQIELIKDGKLAGKVEGLQHRVFETILRCFAVKMNVMLVGPAGSGKTTCVRNAAKTLGIEFYSISVGVQTSKVEFMGYMDANGKYVRTLFREAYEKGGVFLIDEIDAGNPGVLTVVNSALANEFCAFPDKMVKKHDNFICAAAANTWGRGADRMYVGRNQLDAATLDRFVKVHFDYDEVLEEHLSTNKNWFSLIKSIRGVVFNKKLRVLVTPRATFNGCALVHQGLDFWTVLELTVFNGVSDEEKTVIMSNANLSQETLKNKVTRVTLDDNK